jgi:hypothetical protein
MDLIQLANLGEFIGGVAVLVTLVYLAVQVRQSTSAQETAAVQSWFTARAMMQSLPAQNTELSAAIGAGIKDSRALTETNWVQFGFWCQTAIQTAKVVQDLYRRGVIVKGIHDSEIQGVAGFIHYWPGVRQWWDAGGRTQLPPDPVARIEATDPGSFTAYDWNQREGFHPLNTGSSA